MPAVRRLLEHMGLPLRGAADVRPVTVVDLGAGTGKLTRALQRALPPGSTVLAVEPVEDMLAALERSAARMEAETGVYVQLCPNTADAIPAEDASVDGVLAAQAFHWFATEATLRCVHRVLRPGAALGLVWNTMAGDHPAAEPWMRRLRALIDSLYVGGGVPRQQSGEWRRVFTDTPAGTLFGELKHDADRMVLPCTRELVVDRVMSLSVVGALPAERKRELAQQVLAALADAPLQEDGMVSCEYHVEMYYAAKR